VIVSIVVACGYDVTDEKVSSLVLCHSLRTHGASNSTDVQLLRTIDCSAWIVASAGNLLLLIFTGLTTVRSNLIKFVF